MSISRQFAFLNGLAAAFVGWTMLSAPVAAQNAPAGDTFNIEHATRATRQQIQSEVPDFTGLDDLPADIQRRIATHDLDEDALWEFYKDIAPATHTGFGSMNVVSWMERQPTARLPLLATLTAQVPIFGGNLRTTFWSPARWVENRETRPQLQSMRSHLQDAGETASRDPQWYLLMAELLMANRASHEEMTKLVREGVEADPSNFQLAIIAANYFLPKWGSSAETFEAWARTVAEAYPIAERNAMYARLYWQAFRAEYLGQLFHLSRVDWNHLMLGLRDLLALHPSEAHLNQALVLACLGGNREFSREVLLHPRFAYSDRYWYQLKAKGGAYQPCRRWAGA